MHKSLLTALIGLLLLPVAGAAADADVAAPIHQFIDGFNKGDTKSAYAAYASGSVSIIDEFAPHLWTGANAAHAWAAAYDKHAQATGVTDGNVKYGEVTRTEIEGTSRLRGHADGLQLQGARQAHYRGGPDGLRPRSLLRAAGRFVPGAGPEPSRTRPGSHTSQEKHRGRNGHRLAEPVRARGDIAAPARAVPDPRPGGARRRWRGARGQLRRARRRASRPPASTTYRCRWRTTRAAATSMPTCSAWLSATTTASSAT